MTLKSAQMSVAKSRLSVPYEANFYSCSRRESLEIGSKILLYSRRIYLSYDDIKCYNLNSCGTSKTVKMSVSYFYNSQTCWV